MLLYVVMVAAVVGTFAVRAVGRRRAVPELGTNEWMALQQGLPRSLVGDPALSRYATRTRRWRMYGVVGGAAGAIGWTFFPLHDGRRQSNLAVALFIGWFVAGVVPELFVRNRPGGGVRAAALDSRGARRYVTSSAARWLVGSGALTLAALLVRQTVTLRIAPSRADAAMLLSASLLLAIIGTVAVRRIAMRPQPAGGSNDLAVDEAIRKLATTRAVSGWTALQFIAAGYLAPRGFFPHADLVHDTIVVISLVGVTASWAWVPTRVVQHAGLQGVPA
ncbi:MAG: hypothetical protein WCC60_12800 [Ilumatobacteraceae bacterium]